MFNNPLIEKHTCGLLPTKLGLKIKCDKTDPLSHTFKSGGEELERRGGGERGRDTRERERRVSIRQTGKVTVERCQRERERENYYF